MVFSNGPLIDYGIGDDLIFFHGVFASKVGLIKTLFRVFNWSFY
jgi:hypothetical protein